MPYLIIPIAVCLLDLRIKNYMEEKSPKELPKEIWGGRILLRKSHNTGAMLNCLEERQKLVAGFSFGLTACVLLGYLWVLGQRGMHLLKTGLSFLLGGACSNVYDRLVRKYVVDYFSFQVKWKKLRNVVFNIGDIFIFLGSFLVILWNLRRKS